MVADSIKLVGSREAIGPTGKAAADRFTVPVKPLVAVTLTVDLPDDPTGIIREDGSGLRLKSGDVLTTSSPNMMVGWKEQ